MNQNYGSDANANVDDQSDQALGSPEVQENTYTYDVDGEQLTVTGEGKILDEWNKIDEAIMNIFPSAKLIDQTSGSPSNQEAALPPDNTPEGSPEEGKPSVAVMIGLRNKAKSKRSAEAA